MSKKSSRRSASSDWRASQFLLISLGVTALSIMFFFAVRSIFNKMDSLGTASAIHRFAEWGGFVIQDIELDIQPQGKMLSAVEKVQRQIEPLKGKSIFSVDLLRLQENLQSSPAVASAQIRRQLPGQLKVYAQLREPAMILRGPDTWIFADEQAVFISAQRTLRGGLLDLPKIYGLETRLNGEPEEMNRLLVRERSWLVSLSRLMQDLRSRIGVEVLKVEVREDDWMETAVFTLHCRSPKDQEFVVQLRSDAWVSRIPSLQFVLSDLQTEAWSQPTINGIYPERWYVQNSEGRP